MVSLTLSFFFQNISGRLAFHWGFSEAFFGHTAIPSAVPSLYASFNLVEILSKILCGFCAITERAVEDTCGDRAVCWFRRRLSTESSNRRSAHAQGKSISAWVNVRFPHFHSDGYYYDLYTYIKTGYSSLSQK